MSKRFNWDKIRPVAYQIFEEEGIFQCELNLPRCTFGLNPTLAHSMKVREWTTLEEACQVAYICQTCHSYIEAMGKKNIITMTELVQKLEINRGWTIYEKLPETVKRRFEQG